MGVHPSASDLLRQVLEQRVDKLTAWLWFWTGLVVVGILLEHGSHLARAAVRSRGLPRSSGTRWIWIPLWGFMGGLLIVGGVAGQLSTEFMASRAEANLRGFSDKANATLNKEASEAREAAGTAEDHAMTAEEHLQFAKAQAALAEKHASEADERAELARKEAEGFRLQIAHANERAAEAQKAAEDERLARVKIEEKLAPRRLTQEGQRRVAAMLERFQGRPYDLGVDPTPEAINLLVEVDDAVHSAGWINKQPSGGVTVLFSLQLANGERVGTVYTSGVRVELARQTSKLLPAASALIQALRSEGITVTGHADRNLAPGVVHILVGNKT